MQIESESLSLSVDTYPKMFVLTNTSLMNLRNEKTLVYTAPGFLGSAPQPFTTNLETPCSIDFPLSASGIWK